LGGLEVKVKWVSIADRLPDEFIHCFLKYQYPNGYEGRAVGYLDDREWEIEWSDDHAQNEHVTHWLDDED